MAVERVKTRFPGSEDPIHPTKEEKLNQKGGTKPEDDNDDDEDEITPEYKQEEIGPRIGDPVEAAQAVQETKERLESDDVVPLLFPKPVQLQDKGIMHKWGIGVHLVPVEIAGRDKKGMHWWLKHNGVRRTGKPMPNPNAAEVEEKAEAEHEEA